MNSYFWNEVWKLWSLFTRYGLTYLLKLRGNDLVGQWCCVILLLSWIEVGKGPTLLAAGANYFLQSFFFSIPSLWKTVRCRLSALNSDNNQLTNLNLTDLSQIIGDACSMYFILRLFWVCGLLRQWVNLYRYIEQEEKNTHKKTPATPTKKVGRKTLRDLLN